MSPGHFGVLAVKSNVNVSAISKVLGSGAAGAGSVSLSNANIGGTPANGTLMTAVVATQSNINPATQITGPSGWTRIPGATFLHPETFNDPSVSIWYKRAGASEPGPYAWSLPSGLGIQVELMTFSKTGGGLWVPGNTDAGSGTPGLNYTTTGATLAGVLPVNLMGLAIVGVGTLGTISAEAASTYTLQSTAGTNALIAGWKTFNTPDAISATATWTTARRWAGALALFHAES
jgi:hypothetical protein